jgi:hypothetical protein
MEGALLFENQSTRFFLAYHILKLSRDEQVNLVVEFHTNDGRLILTAQDHTEFVNAFYRISQDRANRIVIFAGTSGDFMWDRFFIIWQSR